MASKAQQVRRRSQQAAIRRLVVRDALASWVVPTAAVVTLTVAVFLNALNVLGDGTAAAILLLSLLVLAAFNVLSPALGDGADDRFPWPALLAVGLVWVAVIYLPFHRRLFPGEVLARTRLTDGAVLPVGGHGSRFDLLVEGHMPLASEHRDRFVHYDLAVVDAQGASQTIDGELSDRWRTRRLGRRGTAPSHLEHLSAIHVLDDPAGADLRVQRVTLDGEKNAELAATVYPHRALPLAVLAIAGALLTAAALWYDRWLDADETPWATLLTAVAASAATVFSMSGAGHPGIRDLIGAVLVGAIAGLPIAFLAAWAARLATRSAARPRRRAV